MLSTTAIYKNIFFSRGYIMKALNSANYRKMSDQPEVGGTPSFSGQGNVDSTNQSKSSSLVGSSYDFIDSAQTQAKLPLVGARRHRKKCAKLSCSSKCCHHGKHGQVARQIEKSDSRTNSTLPLSDNDRASKCVQLIETKNVKVILMTMGIPHLSTKESLVLMRYRTRQ